MQPEDASQAKFSKPQTKKNQGRPRKSDLDFLGFVRQIRDFSMAYGQSSQKMSTPSRIRALHA
jgi:hypothetical protein